MLWSKNANFFVYVDLVKTGLEITLSDFAQEKGTFLTLNNKIFQSPKNHIFPKGLMPISFLFRFD